MTIAVNLTGTGISGVTADAITGFVSAAQTASGASQGAQTLPSDIVEYTTSTLNYGPTLPLNANSGDQYFIANDSANSINVWPPVGYKIGTGSTNAALAVPAGKAAKFVALGNNNYFAILSA